MFDDEPPAWDIGDDTTETPAAEGGEAAPAEGAEAAAAGDGTGKPYRLEKLTPPEYNHHWVRPLFLNYGYLYDYRRHYYDDVIDYMDKRQKGLSRETPRAQEWAERAIRMYDLKNREKSVKRTVDMGQIINWRTLIRHYSYHTRAYYSLKYQKIL
ncbi:flightin [Orussus abietinus]|uniref:flightin n=1 Tax=Orussus abietinus TaxID=222816 RepID=UPI0006264B0B|nr:flightin [Orussus abietinus]